MIERIVGWFQQRLARTAATAFDLSLTEYETNGKVAVLARARELKQSEDPNERALGEQLEAEVMAGRVPSTIDGQNGDLTSPLSLPSSSASPGADTPSLESPRSAGEGTEQPKKRRGRPPKNQVETAPPLSTTTPGAEPPKRRGRPPKNQAENSSSSPPN